MTYKTLPKPAKPNRQVQEYVEAFGRGGRLVMPNNAGQWYVTKPNDQKSLLFDTKEEAVAKAEQELAKTNGKVFIFDRDGEVIDSYTPQN